MLRVFISRTLNLGIHGAMLLCFWR